MPSLHPNVVPRWIPMLLVALAGAIVARPPQAKSDAANIGATKVPAAVRAAVDAPDRSAADRALDAGRRPAEILAFFGVRPGMRVAELGAGLGYTSELLARVVGAKGVVYAQNNRLILDRFAQEPWSARLEKPVMRNVVRVDREFDDPLPPEAHELDAVVMILFYHDTVWMSADRAKMNAAVFRALKHGGVFAIVDHSARDGAGLSEVQTLHRIEESALRKEVEAAGFALANTSDLLRNPADTRDWNDSPLAAGDKRGTSDRFTLAFVKP
jgi:predicted methyltransferase